jgi:hypothetical protein
MEESKKKPDPLTDEQCDDILAKISRSLPSAPDEVKGAVTLLASEDQDRGLFGTATVSFKNPLKPEIYRRARAVLNEWLVDLFTDDADADGAEDDTTKHTG